MAKTFLVAVNDTLKRMGEIAGDAGAVTSFTDTARQRAIDNVLQVWNEAINELYILGALQGEVAKGSITLVTDTREYAVPSSPIFEQMSGNSRETRVMIHADTNRTLYQYPGGYVQMFADQVKPENFTGQPAFWALNTKNNKFRINTAPTSAENGQIFTFLYDGRQNLSETTDTFNFTDTVVEALTPVIAFVANLPLGKRSSDAISSQLGFARAIKLLRQVKSRTRYGNRLVPQIVSTAMRPL